MLKPEEITKISDMIKFNLFVWDLNNHLAVTESSYSLGPKYVDVNVEQARVGAAKKAIVDLYDVLNPNKEFLEHILQIEGQWADHKSGKANIQNIENIIALKNAKTPISDIDPAIKLHFIRYSIGNFNSNAHQLYCDTLNADKNQQERMERKPDIARAHRTFRQAVSKYPNSASLPYEFQNGMPVDLDKFDIASMRVIVFMTALENVYKYLANQQTKLEFNNLQQIGMQLFDEELRKLTFIKSVMLDVLETKKDDREHYRVFETLNCKFLDIFYVYKNLSFLYSDLDEHVNSAMKLSPDKRTEQIPDYQYPMVYDELSKLLPGETHFFQVLQSGWNHGTYGRLDDKVFIDLIYMGRSLGYYDEAVEKLASTMSRMYINQYLYKTQNYHIQEVERILPRAQQVLADYDIMKPSKDLLNMLRTKAITVKERSEAF